MARFGFKARAVLAVAVLGLIGAGLARIGRRAGPDRAGIARRALDEGRLPAADEALRAWLATDPTSAEAHLLKGRVALERKQLAEAAEGLKRALAAEPAAPGAPVLQALIVAAAGRPAAAEPALSRAFAAGSVPDRQVDEALAKIRIEAFDLAGAATVLDRWARDFPADPKPHLWRAEVHGRTGGDPAAPAADYREALRRDPHLADARLRLADELGKNHHAGAALAEYATYLAARPDDPAAHLGAARALDELDDEAGAAAHLARALELAPGDVAVHRARAEAAARRGDWPAMLEALDRAVALDPHDLTTHFRRGVALTRLGRLDEARGEQVEAARLRADLARLNQARANLIAAPHDRASQLEIARWMFAHAHDADGVRWAEKVLREWADDPEASRLLADYYRRAGNPGLANYYRLQVPTGGIP